MIKIFNFFIKNNFCRFFKRKSYVEKVTEFFDHLKQYSPSSSDWVVELERRAYKKQPEWQADADSYLHGLVAAGALSTDAAASCRKHLTPCISESIRHLILWPLAWVVIIATMTVARLALVANQPFLIVLVLLTAVASGVWASMRPSLNRYSNSRKRRWDKPLVVAVCTILIPVVIYEFTETVGFMVQQASIKQFNAMCWIDFANQATPPSSTGELFEWADKLRNQAPCQPMRI
ncbi:hypothetical protein XF_2044 [Xylella fastidiosa 9a5c]|uniref:Uncharacterized protein n=1 Tax=Xylella fastidiosa (strain 9a5c) TaxID=160492 RepID=Q9PBU1_XYLFA|nr:hypothetical protein [Xylella fastidiosa]AAF84846.1 hypothetical protein XF_2044 [Xylella fastidiosa 9a5c]